MEETIERTVTIKNRLGLHARAASLFVQAANKFTSEIFVEKGGQEVNGKSIMGILILAAPKGTAIRIRAAGPDAQAALNALCTLVDDGFGEDR